MKSPLILRPIRRLAAAAALVFTAFTSPAADALTEKISPEQLAFFEKKIRPVLVTKCYKCHAADAEKIKGGLVLDTRDGIRMGGETGHGITPGDLKDSLVIRAMRGDVKDLLMPPKEKLPADVLADFERWVLMGAPDPREGSGKLAAKKPDSAAARSFWSFQPVKAAAVPQPKNARWSASDIDRFVLQKLEEHQLTPVADAAAHTLIRRLYFDLVGLPPTPEQVRAFVTDKSPRAF